MKMKTNILLAIGILGIQTTMQAQQQEGVKTWTLEQCISHAHENNITIKQLQLSVASNKNNLTQKKLSLAPSVNGSSNYTVGFGRSENRVGSVVSIEDNTTQQFGVSVRASMPVFEGLSNINNIKKQNTDLQASISRPPYNTPARGAQRCRSAATEAGANFAHAKLVTAERGPLQRHVSFPVSTLPIPKRKSYLY